MVHQDYSVIILFMKITVLNENNTRIDNYLLAEPSLSLYIELENKKILFDTGYSDVFLKNAEAIGINLNSITDFVISHGHNDHTGGLQYYKPISKNINLVAHPKIFEKKIDTDGTSYGCPVSKKELDNYFSLKLSKSPYYISENLIFLGEIEHNTSEDIDDSALTYVKNDKIFIITGCSHAGIINIINYAKKITGINNVYGILGGFHLINMPEISIENIGKFFKEENIKFLAPCHCCDLKSKIILSKYNQIQDVCVGDTYNV